MIRQRYGRLTLTALCCGLVVLTLATGVGAAAAAGSTPVGHDDDGEDVDAEIGSGGVVTVERGGVATVPIRLDGTDTATVNVGYNDVNFNLSFEVVDGDGDGLVRARINAFRVGRANFSASVNETTAASVSAVSANDSIRDVAMLPGGNPGVPAPLVADYYEVNVTHDDRELDVGTLEITEPSEPAAKSWTLPGEEFGTLQTARDVRAAVDDGTLTPDDSIARGDAVVLASNVSIVQGLLAAAAADRNESDYAAAFAALATGEPWTQAVRDGYGFEFLLVSQGLEDRQRLDVAETVANDGLRVVPDFENRTTYLVLDTSSVAFESGAEAVRNATYETMLAADIAADDEAVDRAGDTFAVVDRSVAFAHTNRSFDAARNQTVSGTTTLAPGSTLRLRLDGNGTLQRTASADVRSNESFTASFDLSDVTSHAAVNVTATNADGEALRGTVDAPDEPNDTDGTTDESDGEGTDEFGAGTDGPTETDDDTVTDASGPGFSAALAVLALLGTVVVARRHSG